MSKTISLKLSDYEENIINKIMNKGISPSKILRGTLNIYFSQSDQAVYPFNLEKENKTCQKINQIQKKVNLNQRGEVNLVNNEVNHFDQDMVNQINQVNQKVNQFQEKKVNLVNQFGQKVNLNQEGEVNLINNEVNHPQEEMVNQLNQKVNLFYEIESKYLTLYIDQLNIRINQLESNLNEYKNKDFLNNKFLIDSFQALQNEYQNVVKDFIKRIDDKFDRIMFYLEESRKTQIINSKSDDITKYNDLNEKEIRNQKSKKDYIFQMYRM